MRLDLTKAQAKSLYEGLDHLVYLEPMVKKEDRPHLYEIFQLVKKELRQEEINHPEETVHGRAFIKNFDD
tara:strand:- start:653 stop:862 length:210 start_codon:yes stop_codon:yes gene_type:complete